MKNLNKIKIDKLQSKINPIQKEIYGIEEQEREQEQLPRCRKMVG